MVQEPRTWVALSLRSRQCSCYQRGFQTGFEIPTDHPATEAIEGDRQVRPTFGRRDVRDITLPNLIGRRGLSHLGQPVFGNWQRVSAVGRARTKAPLLPCTPALLTH